MKITPVGKIRLEIYRAAAAEEAAYEAEKDRLLHAQEKELVRIAAGDPEIVEVP